MKNEGALRMRLGGMTESIGPMCRHIFLPPGPSRFPVGWMPGYKTRRKERALPIVLDGALASVARLRFTGTINLKRLPEPGK